MADLVQIKLDGISSEVEHHRLAKILKLATTNAEIKRLETDGSNPEKLAEAKAEALQLESELVSEGITTAIVMAKEYPYGIGLIMGKELIISALPTNINDLRKKVTSVMVVS